MSNLSENVLLNCSEYRNFSQSTQMENLNHSVSDSATDSKEPNMFLHPTHQVLLLIVSCFGLVTNSLSAAVWFKRFRNKRPGTLSLGCLSVSDALLCLSVIVEKPLELCHGTSCSLATSDAMIYVFSLTSKLMTVAVVVQRWLIISRPSTIGQFLSSRGHFIAIPIFSVTLLGTIVLEVYNAVLYCKYGDESLKGFSMWINIIVISSFSRDAVIVLCLIVFSILLLHASCTMKKALSPSVSINWHGTLEQRMSIIVSCIVVFSLLEMFAFLLFILVLFGYADLGIQPRPLKVLHQWTLVLNSSINFVFYVSFGQDFRRTLLSMCSRVVPRLGRRKTKGKEYSKDNHKSVEETGLENSKV